MPRIFDRLKGHLLRGLGRIIVIVIFPLIAIAGPMLMADELYASWQMSATTQGTVTESYVRNQDKAEPLSQAVVLYQYHATDVPFNGYRYRSSWWTPGTEWGSLVGALLTKWEYPVGTQVTVHYCPSQPERCCLHRGLSPWSLGLTLITLGMLIIVLNQYTRVILVQRLVEDGYPFLFLMPGLVLLLIGPHVVTLTWLLIIALLMFVLSTPGWKLLCRWFTKKPTSVEQE